MLNKNKLFFSIVLFFLFSYLFPYKVDIEQNSVFIGYPLAWLIVHDLINGKFLASSTNINTIYIFLNICFFYIIIFCVENIIKRLKNLWLKKTH